MGLFDFFLKKKPAPCQEHPKSKAEVMNELEQADSLGSIATVLAENNIISKPIDENHNTFGEDLQHLTPDGELPFGWVYYYQQFIGQQEKKIDTKWKSVYSATKTQEKLEAYEKYFDTVARVGAVCKKTGECHYKWFCEYILDSDWYKTQVDDYEEFKVAAPDLIKRDTLLETLEHDIMNKLQECDGMLQSDFVKLFDPLIKKDVSDYLYNAERYGKIKRTKSGRSYILEIKK